MNIVRKMALCLGSAAVVVMLGGCDAKVSDFRAEKFQEIKTKIASEPAWVYMMQKVLDARHGSVRAKGIEVEDLTVHTLGDDPVVKRDLSNLKDIEVKFRILWDGVIHKDGYTCTTFVFDKDWNVKRILPGETNAKVDLAANRSKEAAAAGRKARAKLGEWANAMKAKWNEMKPQVKEQFHRLESQVDAALEELNRNVGNE